MVNSDSGQVRDNHDTIAFYLDPASGTITADGVTKTNAATGTYSAGQRIHAVANPPSGYSFTSWETNGVSVDDQLTQDTYMTVSANGWLKAHFQQQQALTRVRSNSILGMELSGIKVKVDRSYYSTPFSLGLQGKHKFKAPSTTFVDRVKYYFARWEGESGATVSKSASFAYNVQSGKTLYAVYGPKQHKLTLYVNDLNARKAIPGATVQLSYQGQSLEATTDTRGKVVFGGIYAGQPVTVTITMNGCQSCTTTLTLSRNTKYRVSLTPA
jgi:hypothetical protein